MPFASRLVSPRPGARIAAVGQAQGCPFFTITTQALGVPIDPSLPDGCPRREWLGSGGVQCDGCGMSRDELWRNTWAGAEAEDDEEAPSDAELDVDVCERCRYTACEACAVHHSRGTCYCKDANFGHAYPPEGCEEREWYHRGYW